MTTTRTSRRYDYRLRNLVRVTQDITWAVKLGVPPSTARGWLTAPDTPVVTAEFLNLDATRLQQEVLRLRRCIQKLTALLRILLVVFRISGYSLNQARLPDGHDKRLLLRAIEQSRSTLPLRALLRVLRLSPSRFYHWKRDQHCALDDRPSCPRLSPQQLTAALAHSQPAPEKGTLVALL